MNAITVVEIPLKTFELATGLKSEGNIYIYIYIYMKFFFKFFCVCLLLEKLVNGKHFLEVVKNFEMSYYLLIISNLVLKLLIAI